MLLKSVSHAALAEPSAWVLRFSALIRREASVLDLACGRGRHVDALLRQGLRVTGVDRDPAGWEGLRLAHADALQDGRLRLLQADLESAPWPLPGNAFDAVVVTNYLWRPLWPTLRAALGPGGVLIYETFADGQQTVGRPSRPEFLLQRGELLRACEGLHVVAYEDVFEAAVPRYVQRIAAQLPASIATPKPAASHSSSN